MPQRMNHPLRAASFLTLIVAFIALWFAFVTSGDEPASDWPLAKISPVLMTLFLMGALGCAALAGLVWSALWVAGRMRGP